MPINNTPYVSTNVETPHVPNASSDMALQAFLQGQKNASENAMANKKFMMDKASRAEMQKELAKLQEKNPKSALSVSEKGVSASPAPGLNEQKFQAGQGLKAAQNVNNQYSKGLPKLQDQAQAVSEIQDALNNPSQMSLGTVRTNLLKAYGMNRYNESEAKSILPSSIYSTVSGLMSKTAGGDSESLSPSQAKDVARLIPHMLGNIQARHETLKNTALASYPQGADPAYMPQDLGHPMSSQLENLSKFQYKEPSSQQAPAQGMLAQAGSALKSFFTPKSSGAAQQSPAQPSAQAPSKGVVDGNTLNQYAQKHGMTADAAKDFLGKQGYSFGQ